MKNNSNNGLTPTMVLRFINSQLGVSVQKIELTTNQLMRVVFQQSIPTFSQYFPFLPMCDITDSDRINGSYTDYRLPNEYNLKILSLHKHYINSDLRCGGGWITPYLLNPIDAQIMDDRMSMITTPLIIDFWPPNRVNIKQNYFSIQGLITLQFKAVHPNHMKTIEANLRDDFLHLCLYDVLIALYPMRHRFQSINTPYATLEPFYEMVDSAKGDRDALLEKWKNSYLSAGEQKKIWIA